MGWSICTKGELIIRSILIIVTACLLFVGVFVFKNMPEENSALGENSAHTENAALPRLVDLGSDKCIPCKKMAPILENLTEQYKGSLVVDVIDIKKNPEAAEPWNIRVIPTQIFLDAQGQELFRHEGFMAHEAILAKWQELGIDLKILVSAEAI